MLHTYLYTGRESRTFDYLSKDIQQGWQIVGVDERKPALASHVFRLISQHPCSGGALVADCAIVIQEDDDVEGVFSEQAKVFFAVAQRLLCPLALGDISTDTDKPHRGATGVAHERDTQLYRKRAAVFGNDAILSIADEPFVQGLFPGYNCLCPVSRGDEIKGTLSYQLSFVLGPIHFQGCLIDLNDPPLQIGDDNAICGYPDSTREAEERLLRSLTLGDVAHNGHDFILSAGDSPRLIVPQGTALQQPIFADLGLARLQGLLNRIHQPLRHLRRMHLMHLFAEELLGGQQRVGVFCRLTVQKGSVSAELRDQIRYCL